MAQYPHFTFVAVLLLLLSPSLLGSQNDAKILHGEETENITPFQSQVSLEVICNATKDDTTPLVNRTTCGGVALGKYVVGTAASCLGLINQPGACMKNATVSMFVTYTNERKIPYFVKVNQKYIYEHPKYTRDNEVKTNVNLALVVVEDPLTVKLGIINDTDKTKFVVDNEVRFAGWGPSDDTSDSVKTKLYENNEVYSITNVQSVCQGNKPLGMDDDEFGWYCVAPTTTLTDAQKNGPCHATYQGGDFGGAVYSKNGESVMGIMVPTAFNVCKQDGKINFGILKLANYTDWIESTISKHSPSTGPLFFSPFLLGLLALVQFHLF